ncbi:hypothetical protein SKUN_00632 [Spiroplasma kunkelii CR2-3x]|uniref:Uncharacterized protein n=1 Tax=Spiroplasma kunkelii CR2-3x TaxID=273035 RepID=A0A0K2JG03_SPIKU|nr:hypothetical protein [Spiroplasma kunkelii]ALA97525.1 hypothetical protein SKUN_00632 [Spiroplasma kunkelii CR2-3x]
MNITEWIKYEKLEKENEKLKKELAELKQQQLYKEDFIICSYSTCSCDYKWVPLHIYQLKDNSKYDKLPSKYGE